MAIVELDHIIAGGDGLIAGADVCIVGSGAAGFSIAREFLGTHTSVVVLEGGGSVYEEASQDPYRAAVVGLPHHGIHIGRARVLGGSTTLWAGQALPLFEPDFAHRSWIPNSGWPIERSELEPYYDRAQGVMQIPHVTNDVRSWPSIAPPPPAYDPSKLVTFYSQFTTTPNFADKYRADIASAANITLITHANVVELRPNADASVLNEAVIVSRSLRRVIVRARFFVVCCGGIDTARLLLLSDSVEPHGIGNARDVVGRYFADHAHLAVPIEPVDRRRFGALYDPYRYDGIRIAVKIAASPDLQRREKISHIGSEVYYPSSTDDPIRAAKNLLKFVKRPSKNAAVVSAFWKVARRPDKVLAAAYRHYIRGVPPSVGSTEPHLDVFCEQLPNPDSRVTLGAAKDRFGVRRTVLDWRMTAEDTRSMRVFMSAIAAEWKRLNIANLKLESVAMDGRERGENGGYADNNHHIGTTRMGSDRATSVVDSRCKVHGYDNLYVGSSSVFPTGGFSNPTLTIIALCLRIADDIKLRISEPRYEANATRV